MTNQPPPPALYCHRPCSKFHLGIGLTLLLWAGSLSIGNAEPVDSKLARWLTRQEWTRDVESPVVALGGRGRV